MDGSRTAARIDAPAAALPAVWRDRATVGAFVLLWCTGYPAGKIAVDHGAPFTVLAMRFGTAAAIFAIPALLGRAPRPSRADVWHNIVIGVLSLSIAFGGVYAGLSLGVSTGIAALIVGAMPLTTALFATLYGERLSLRQWAGLALGFAGIALVLEGRFDSHGAPLAGYLASIAGLFALSYGTLYQKRHSSHVDVRVGLAVQHATALAVLLPIAAFVEHFKADWSGTYIAAMGWLVLLNSVGGFAVFYVLLQRGAATGVAALFYLMPPITALIGFAVLGEKLTLPMLPGFLLVVVGVWLGTRRAPR